MNSVIQDPAISTAIYFTLKKFKWDYLYRIYGIEKSEIELFITHIVVPSLKKSYSVSSLTNIFYYRTLDFLRKDFKLPHYNEGALNKKRIPLSSIKNLDSISPPPDTSTPLINISNYDVLQTMIKNLSFRQKFILCGCLLDGLSYNLIAFSLGLSESSICLILKETISKLKLQNRFASFVP